MCARTKTIKRACPIIVFGPWLGSLASDSRRASHAAVLKEFEIGAAKRGGKPWRKFVDVECNDAEARDSSHFSEAGAHQIFAAMLPHILECAP